MSTSWRKCSRDAVTRLYSDRKGRLFENNAVSVSENGRFLELFGQRIAYLDSRQRLWVCSAGYQTFTTKERLNALPGVTVQQQARVWYLNAKRWDSSLWTCVDYWEMLHAEAQVPDIHMVETWEAPPLHRLAKLAEE